MKILIGCECSGRVREAFRSLGFDAWSCDLKPSEDNSPFHLQCDLRALDLSEYTAAVFHPLCTRLTLAGVQWLRNPPPGRTWESIHEELDRDAEFFSFCWNAPIRYIAVENPRMHTAAKLRIRNYEEPAQIIQPWWFGDPRFKATCLWLKGFYPLVPMNTITPPDKGSAYFKCWSSVNGEPDTKAQATNRARTPSGFAYAMATQWGDQLTWEAEDVC